MAFLDQLGEIGDNFLDIIEASTDSFASNIAANATADQARAAAIAASVEISAMRARNQEKRKDEILKLVKTLLIILGVGGLLSIVIISTMKNKK